MRLFIPVFVRYTNRLIRVLLLFYPESTSINISGKMKEMKKGARLIYLNYN